MATDSQTGPSRQSDGTLGVTACFLALATGILVVSALSFSLPQTVLDLPIHVRANGRKFIPEGWQFFTRSPLASNIIPYSLTSSGWHSAAQDGTLSPSHVFGWDRKSRAEGLEIGLLVAKVPSSAWLQCTVLATTCLKAIPSELRLPTPVPAPTLCGTIGLANTPPLPWAYARFTHTGSPTSTIVRLTVTCGHGTP